jgi:hypothetical protein
MVLVSQDYGLQSRSVYACGFTGDCENFLLKLLFCSQYHNPYFQKSGKVLAVTIMVAEESTSSISER